MGRLPRLGLEKGVRLMLNHSDHNEIRRIAAAYPPEARHVPADERARYFTDAQHLAWLLRFDPARAAEVMSANDPAETSKIRADRTRPRATSHRIPHYG